MLRTSLSTSQSVVTRARVSNGIIGITTGRCLNYTASDDRHQTKGSIANVSSSSLPLLLFYSDRAHFCIRHSNGKFFSSTPFPSIKNDTTIKSSNNTRNSNHSNSISNSSNNRGTSNNYDDNIKRGKPPSWRPSPLSSSSTTTSLSNNYNDKKFHTKKRYNNKVESKNNHQRHHNAKNINEYKNENKHNNHISNRKRMDQSMSITEYLSSPNDNKKDNHIYNNLTKTSSSKEEPIHPLDKLKDSFMQSLQLDRERRRTNNFTPFATDKSGSGSKSSSNIHDSSNTNTESKLDQLLRMSRERAKITNKNTQNNPNPNNNNNNNNTYSFNNYNYNGRQSGAKAFRESRKIRQQNQNNMKLQSQEQRREQYPNRNNSNNSLPEQKRKQYRNRIDTNTLQKELLQASADAMNIEINIDDNDDQDRSEDDKVVILPREDLTLVQLSTLFRVPKDKIVKTMRQLGESVPKVLLLTSSKASDDVEKFTIDVDMAELIALELGLDPQRAKRTSCKVNDAERRVLRMSGDEDTINSSTENFPTRPPVVCIMGHVDHGKTTLMDALRERALEAAGGNKNTKKPKKKSKKSKGGTHEGEINKIAGTEAGGITQKVSAFQVSLPSMSETKVTFLDTPGHAAFKAMRQSGSNGADVIVLIVAADDGVSPQTIEIIDMYKSIARSQPESISLVVAITKIDKPGIDVDKSLKRIENQLMEHDIYCEDVNNSANMEFGGVQMFPVSGITGDGLDELIEGLSLQSEIMDLRADNEARAEGLIIDAKMEKGLGVVADCIVRWGTLGLGDFILSGVNGGKVRILNDVNNKSIKQALPSQPVRIVGLKTLPKAGDAFVCVQSEEMAKEIIDRREARNAKESHRAEISDDPLDIVISGGASKKGFMAQNVLNRYGLGDKDEEENDKDNEDVVRIPVILKADADGTLAALRDTIMAIQDESKLNLCIDPISMGIGHVTPAEVTMAAESGAGIFCFNLKGSKDKVAMSIASSEGVEIRGHDVIYHLLDEAKDVFSTYCPPTPIEKVHGKATVKAIFDINNNKNTEKIAGLMVEEGYFYLDKSAKESGFLECYYRVTRGKEVISPERMRAKSLRRVKEEVQSVRRGEECGLNLQNFSDLQEGDVIECYSTEMKQIFV